MLYSPAAKVDRKLFFRVMVPSPDTVYSALSMRVSPLYSADTVLPFSFTWKDTSVLSILVKSTAWVIASASV